jgi:ABC-type lipoprotein export system ATPase subunit
MIELDDVFVLHPVLDRQVAALRGLSLTVTAGERVVISGPSGSGKSTLVQLVTGQVRPSAGSAIVLDHDLANASAKAVMALQRSGLGIITQHMVNNLAPELSGVGNVAMQSRLSGRSRTDAHADAVSMLQRLDIGHLADRPLSTISAGEAQRVALAAALAHRPRVIVADEPTGALDDANAAMVFDLLAELSSELDAALLVVSHDPAAGRIGQRVLEIRDGRLGTEQIEGDPVRRLVVDQRGWLRLPEPDRARTGIVDRAVLHTGQPTAITLGPPDGQAAHALPRTSEPPRLGDGRDIAVLDEASRSIGSVRLVAPTTLRVRAGEVLVVSGRSGSGKTTLLGLIGGFAEPTEGAVQRPVGTTVAVGTATPGFAETLTVRQNIELACAVRGNQVDAALRASIDERLHAVGLTELADRPVCTLSGGERQRVSIVRALAGGADLVLLDEPTSQLDQGLARRVSQFLVEHARAGHAVVCASHEPELIAAADRVHSLS